MCSCPCSCLHSSLAESSSRGCISGHKALPSVLRCLSRQIWHRRLETCHVSPGGLRQASPGPQQLSRPACTTAASVRIQNVQHSCSTCTGSVPHFVTEHQVECFSAGLPGVAVSPARWTGRPLSTLDCRGAQKGQDLHRHPSPLKKGPLITGHSIMFYSIQPDSRQVKNVAHLAWGVCLCISIDVFMPAASLNFAI